MKPRWEMTGNRKTENTDWWRPGSIKYNFRLYPYPASTRTVMKTNFSHRRGVKLYRVKFPALLLVETRMKEAPWSSSVNTVLYAYASNGADKIDRLRVHELTFPHVNDHGAVCLGLTGVDKNLPGALAELFWNTSIERGFSVPEETRFISQRATSFLSYVRMRFGLDNIDVSEPAAESPTPRKRQSPRPSGRRRPRRRT